MLQKIISGGQTGADQAGLRAARAAEIATGGWAPQGWATEDGAAPWLAEFALAEWSSPGYPARTVANARLADATIWFGGHDSSGFRATMNACRRYAKPVLVVAGSDESADQIVEWIAANDVTVLNVAGDRESHSPGIGGWVEALLLSVLRRVTALRQNSQ